MTVLATHLYSDPQGRTWDLDRDMLDYHAGGWQWDGQPYDPANGPSLRAFGQPDRTEQLLALAACADLFQVPLSAPQDLAHLLDARDTTTNLCAWANTEAPA